MNSVKKNTMKRKGKKKVGRDTTLVPLKSDTPYVKRPYLIGYVMTKSTGILVTTLTNFVIAEQEINNLTNFDLTGGTGTMSNSTSGLLDFAPYALGRVETVSLRSIFTNLEPAIPVGVTIFLSDTQPSTVITTHATAILASTNYLASRSYILGALSGQGRSPPLILNSSMKKIVQDGEVKFDRDFISTINPTPVAPNQVIWMGVVTYTLDSTNFTVGCAIENQTTIRVKGFSRLPDS
jgi:hypothetical protein